jgi:hypothetical protein
MSLSTRKRVTLRFRLHKIAIASECVRFLRLLSKPSALLSAISWSGCGCYHSLTVKHETVTVLGNLLAIHLLSLHFYREFGRALKYVRFWQMNINHTVQGAWFFSRRWECSVCFCRCVALLLKPSNMPVTNDCLWHCLNRFSSVAHCRRCIQSFTCSSLVFLNTVHPETQ